MDLLNNVIDALKKEHGGQLNLKENSYFLFLKDSLVSVWYDDNEKTMKIDVELLDGNKTFVYFTSDVILEDLF